MSTLTLSSSNTSSMRLLLFVLLATGLHLFVIFGIALQGPLNIRQNLLAPVIEVTLATNPSELSPEEAKFIASHHQMASSPVDSTQVPKSLQNADFPATQIHELWQPPQPETQIAKPEQIPEKVTTISNSTASPQSQPLPDAQENANLVSTEQQALSQRIASLMAELSDQQQQYAQMPRKRSVTAAAEAAADAEYLYNWRMHIEKVGNLNYPAAARRLGLHGEVLLMVAINADGSLHDVQVRQSSGSKILDEAALRIVRLAAPFQPLPEEILSTTDILEVIRTWQFRTDQSWGAG